MEISEHPFIADGWRIDPRSLRMRRGGETVRVGERAMAVLCRLVANQGDLVTKRALIDEVWEQREVTDDVLTVAIYELRKAFGDSARTPRFIETIHGRGYRWLIPVSKPPASPVPEPASEPTPEPAPESAAAPPATAVVTAPRADAAAPSAERRRARPRRLAIVLSIVAIAALAVAAIVVDVTLSRTPTATLEVPPSFEALAVLPLADFGTETPIDDTTFADGMTGTLINALARQGFRVSAHSSVMAFRESRPPLSDIASALDADAILEGGVRRDPHRTTVELQLVDPDSDQVLWAAREDMPNESALWLGQRLARSIRRFIAGDQAPGSTAPDVAAKRLSLDILDRYLEGRAALRRGALEEAIETFESVREREPDFAENLAGLVEARLLTAERDPGDVASWRAAKNIARQALEVDPEMAEAHAALGVVSLLYDWDFDRAEEQLEEALRINPSLPLALDFEASLWTLRGLSSKAIAQADRAVRTDPLSPWRYLSRGWHLLFAGRPAEALANFEAMPDLVETRDSAASGNVLRALALEQLGRDREAWALRRAWLAERGVDEAGLDAIEAEFESTGLAAFYRAAHEQLGDRLTTIDRAYTLIHMGEHERALDLFEQAIESRNPEVLWMGLMPHTQAVRTHPRFQDLLARLPTAY